MSRFADIACGSKESSFYSYSDFFAQRAKKSEYVLIEFHSAEGQSITYAVIFNPQSNQSELGIIGQRGASSQTQGNSALMRSDANVDNDQTSTAN